MSAEAINVIVTIGGHPYTVDLVGDPDDVMFALNVGRAVSETLVTHGAKVRKLEQLATDAGAPPPPPPVVKGHTEPKTGTGACRNCGRGIRWHILPGYEHIGVWRHDSPATPDTRCSGAAPR